MILAVDPGKVTGYAWFTEDGEFQGAHQLPQDAFFDEIGWQWIRMIVCEDYVITPGTLAKTRGERNWAIEGIGALRQIARKRNIGFQLQKPASVLPLITDKVLWHLGIDISKEHAKDAARHGVYWLARAGRIQLAVR